MKQLYLAAAAAIVVTTSLVSNLLWLAALRPRTAVARNGLQSALGGFRDLVDLSVAAVLARSERQAVSSDASLDDDSRPQATAGRHR
jgi:hypothetical protein